MSSGKSVNVMETYLPGGLDTPQTANPQQSPGAEQTQDGPPLQTSRVLDHRRGVQRLSVPEIIHRRTALTFRHKPCLQTHNTWI